MKKRIISLLLPTLFISLNATAQFDDKDTTENIFGINTGNFYTGFGANAEQLFLGNKTNLLVTTPLPPATPDQFSLKTENSLSGSFSGFIGYQWSPKADEFISLFLEYERSLSSTENGTRYAYSSPSASSSYKYALLTQSLFLGFKFDFITGYKIGPYGELGVGVSRNRFSNFNNDLTYSFGLSPVITPFPNKSTYNLATFIGFGADMQLTRSWLLSVGYRFEYLGDVKSGDISNVPPPPVGTGLPFSPVHLSNTVFSNVITTKISYLF